MHIPDGFLDAKIWVTAAALSTGAIGYSVSKSREELDERQVPKLGIMAAFIFAAQMVNFPVGVGTWVLPAIFWEPPWLPYCWVPGAPA